MMIAPTKQKTSASSRSREETAAAASRVVVSPPPGPAPLRRRPMAERGPRVLRKARQFGWRSPEMAAVLAFSFFVSLALFYVTAYARVTLQGYEYAQLTEELKIVEQQADDLQAQIDQAKDRHRVEETARQLGLQMAPPEALHFLNTTAPANTILPQQLEQP